MGVFAHPFEKVDNAKTPWMRIRRTCPTDDGCATTGFKVSVPFLQANSFRTVTRSRTKKALVVGDLLLYKSHLIFLGMGSVY